MLIEAAAYTREHIFALLQDGLSKKADRKITDFAVEKHWGRTHDARLRALCELVGKGNLSLGPAPDVNMGDVNFMALTKVFLNFPHEVHDLVVSRVLDQKGMLGIDRQAREKDIDLAEYAGSVADLMGEGLIRVDGAGVLCVEGQVSQSPVL